jgi:hypothetical protein
MCDSEALLSRARSLGLRVEREGDRIAISPARLCPRDLLDDIRRHKRLLLDTFDARAYGLPPDCAPWFHVARQVLQGEFGGADRSTKESVAIGLRATAHPLCRRALEYINRKQ